MTSLCTADAATLVTEDLSLACRRQVGQNLLWALTFRGNKIVSVMDLGVACIVWMASLELRLAILEESACSLGLARVDVGTGLLHGHHCCVVGRVAAHSSCLAYEVASGSRASRPRLFN